MAWTGAPTVVAIDHFAARITGISLAAGAAGTISLNGGGGNIELPADLPSTAPTDPVGLTMADVVQVSYLHTAAATNADHMHVVKTNAPFLITFTNDDGAAATGALEIYVVFLKSLMGTIARSFRS